MKRLNVVKREYGRHFENVMYMYVVKDPIRLTCSRLSFMLQNNDIKLLTPLNKRHKCDGVYLYNTQIKYV